MILGGCRNVKVLTPLFIFPGINQKKTNQEGKKEVASRPQEKLLVYQSCIIRLKRRIFMAVFRYQPGVKPEAKVKEDGPKPRPEAETVVPVPEPKVKPKVLTRVEKRRLEEKARMEREGKTT